MTGNRERTFIMIKPDGVHRGLIGEIIKRYEQKGFKLVAMKFIQASKEDLEKHYSDSKEGFYSPEVESYMTSGPIVAMVWEGLNVIKIGSTMVGDSIIKNSRPGTIRGDFCIEEGRNICEASDSTESANKKISLWFKGEDLTQYDLATSRWIYEDFSPTVLHPRMNDRLSDPKLKMAFSTFDKDDDGRIEENEFSLAMKELGFEMTFAEIKLLMKGVDADRNGFIDFFEFCTMVAMFDEVQEKEESTMAEEALKIYFRAFDEDGNGYISHTELRQVMASLGVEVTAHQIDSWIQKADVDGDGRVNYEEFFMLKELTELKEAIIENVKSPRPSAST